MTMLDDQARAILRGNDRGGYTVPTDMLYPFQWNWDSAFAAWGFSTFDSDRAWREFETLLAAQWADGMVPHMVFHDAAPGYFPGPDVWGAGGDVPTSGISQPPVAATLMRMVWEADPEAGTERLRALYPRLLAWHRWWMQTRCASGAVAVCHPWESGRDNCPDWDVGLANVDGSGAGDYARRDAAQVDGEQRPTKLEYDRYLALVRFGRECGWDQQTIVERCPFLMADPGITFLLIRAHDDLAALGRALGEDVSEIAGWAAELRAGVQTLWNPELQSFDARDLRSGAWAGVVGSGALLCWLARCERPEMEAHLARMWDAVTYGLPSSDPEAPSFERKRYWRGPVWPQMNALIGLGLLSAGRDWDEARLREETAALIESAGFREYFDPLDAAPCGGDNFTWTAAVWLAWAGR
ncbi:MGH1-like glycoside hydrolase domain-containing protein [Salipiger bermudensis]|nr:hypothetical protein [Salipiger bermudensis]